MATTTTDRRHAEARTMRAAGETYPAIAAALGVSKQTVRRWLVPEYAEQSRASSRKLKARYRGTCIDCGAPTDGNSGPGKARPRCIRCFNASRAKWNRDTVVSAIRRFSLRHGRAPAAVDFNPHMARSLGRDDRAERCESDGDYPRVLSVQEVFGSWAAALEAAGFRPNPTGAAGWESRRTDGWTIEDAA